MTFDAVEIQVFRHLLAAIPEEMGVVLMRSAFSPNIKERRDFSCALTGPDGGLAAQASHIPVHLGSVHVTGRHVLDHVAMRPGDMVLLNDPYRGGTHLPDITLFAPVFLGDRSRPSLGVLTRAHHADIGGAHPGSMGSAFDLLGEGLVIPPVRLVREGELDDDILAFLLANTRTPDERLGDILAQRSAVELGRRRVEELASTYGVPRLLRALDALRKHAERATRRMLRSLDDGTWRASMALDGPGSPVIRVLVEKLGDGLTVDFTGTDAQVADPFNANPAITLSAVFYVVRLLLDDDVPTNAGCLEPVLVTIPPGSLLDPVRPAPVAGGNVETSQRVVDVLLAALHPAAPDRIPAASQGTMNNLTVGGGGERPFTFYETIGGGAGAGPRGGGASGIQTHMTNTLNTPVEALESAFPVIVTRYHRRNRSGGSGRHRGGDGLVREILARAPIQVTVLASRRHEGAPGLLGGGRGRPGRDRYREGRGPWRAFPRSGTVRLETGDSVRVETPGGGGYGLERRGTRRRRTGKGRPLRRPRK